MKELIEYIAKTIADHPDEIVATETEEEDRVVIRLEVAQDDKGKIINSMHKPATRYSYKTSVPKGADKIRGGNEVDR